MLFRDGWPPMKVAIVHYWLVTMRGGEKVLEELLELFPDADIFTHVVRPEALPETLRRRTIKTTFIASLPGAARHYQKYLPLMPMALEQLDLRGYDLVISSESGPAKGVITDADAVHVCYCHSPMRYLWNMYQDYRESTGSLMRLLMAPVFHRLRIWDVTSSARVDHFIANSTAVAQRIRKYYRREAIVIPPPVACETFSIAAPQDFYLCCGQLVAYKKIELAVEAFNRMGKKLVVIGAGERLDAVRKLAGPSVTVMGAQPFAVLKDHLERCRALVFPGEEDFGIVPVEAMASGRPVIAFDKSGVRDSVVDGKTGILFEPQTVEGLIAAVTRFEASAASFDPAAIAAHAAQFDRAHFRTRFLEALRSFGLAV